MNLLSIMRKSMTSKESVKALSARTGISEEKLQETIPMALPVLMQATTRNASDHDGAASLSNALTQHTSTEAINRQLEEADAEDGAKIVRHIFGDQTEDVCRGLGERSGLSSSLISSLLSNLAPSFLSGLSSTNTANQSAQASGSSGIFGLLGSMFGGSAQEEPQNTSSISGLSGMMNLFGMGQEPVQEEEEPQPAGGLSDLLGMFSGGQSAPSQSNSGAFIPFGGSQASDPSPASSATGGFDGSSLLNLLSSFMG